MISGNSCLRKLNLFRKKKHLLKLINLSLLLGHMRRTLKRGVINSLIKKRNVDQCDLANYYPISKLSFHLQGTEQFCCSPVVPSHAQKWHMWDVLALDRQSLSPSDIVTSFFLAYLDVSSVLRTTDHNILSERLHFGNGVEISVDSI